MEIYEFGALIICIVVICVGLVVGADVIREWYND